MAEIKDYNSFQEFWPFYLAEHSKPLTRAFHYIGVFCCFLFLFYSLSIGNYWLLLIVTVPGYFWAWMAHFFIQKNKPATFKYPLWSLRGDIKMFFYFVTGRIDAELKRFEIKNVL